MTWMKLKGSFPHAPISFEAKAKFYIPPSTLLALDVFGNQEKMP